MYTIIYGKEQAQFLQGPLSKAGPFEVLFLNNEIRVVVTRKNRKYSAHAYNLYNSRVCMSWPRHLGTPDNEGGLTELRRSDVGFLLHRLSLLSNDGQPC